jgi:hypothetical protein
MRRHSVLLLALLAAGCASRPGYITEPPDKPETQVQAQERRTHAARPAYNLAGYPLAVREGYVDGCESAKATEFARKDGRRMGDDKQYAMGWHDGFSICGAKKK